MMENIQFLSDKSGKPVFAVIPFDAFKLAFPEHANAGVAQHAPDATAGHAVSEVTHIDLPYSGGHQLDVVRLVEYFYRRSVSSIASATKKEHVASISVPLDQQRKRLADASKRPLVNGMPGLDVLIRTHFLPADSPYRDTVQAVGEVVEALVATGLFRRSKRKFEAYYRPVNALDFDNTAGYYYLLHHGAIDPNGKSLLSNPVPRDFMP